MLTDGRVQAAGAGIAPGPRAQLCPPAVAGWGRVCPARWSSLHLVEWSGRAGDMLRRGDIFLDVLYHIV